MSHAPTPTPDAPAIDLDHLSVRYGSFVAVDDLTFTVRRGEIFGLLGPNGAGKTTTFLCLTQQVGISSGAVRIFGLDLNREFDAIKPRFGYVPDTENHFDEFTAEQNLRLFAELYDVNFNRIDYCLELVELDRARHLPVLAYSKGMKKKLLLARELLHEPELLLLDEPTANLDVHSTARIRRILQELARAGTTVFVTTHNMTEVEEMCDRVAIINHGKLIDLDTPTAFKVRHTERIVAVVLEGTGPHARREMPLPNDPARRDLAELLTSEIPVTLHTREFNFYQAFLKLTGEEYN
ncbi:MAG TPA: ABC transporter ATP-binding protein [Gemmatales bacterium]|nr:ABC transporter ATP-binding protein [Gemmatales bacterium]